MQCCFSSKCIEFEGGLDILTRKLDKNTIFFALYKVLYSHGVYVQQINVIQ